MKSLTVDQTTWLFVRVAGQIISSQDLLTEADRAIGDGDHGVGMSRGFEAVRNKLISSSPTDLAQLFHSIGTELLLNIGGASGAIFGTFFRAGSKNLAGLEVFDAAAFHNLLSDGLAGVVERGKAKVGDKTLVDVLFPMVEKSAEHITSDLDIALDAVRVAAHQGMESTKDMVATVGRAKTLGERSLGHLDPGSISMYLIVKFMTEDIAKIPV